MTPIAIRRLNRYGRLLDINRLMTHDQEQVSAAVTAGFLVVQPGHVAGG